jgi:putative tryptophan/tyrosine transport system substrate-binding protein
VRTAFTRSCAVAYDLPSAFAAKAATKTIPIAFLSGSDPVKAGLVESFSRPNRNLTGVSIFFGVLGPKRVELLRELLPAGKTVAVLGNPHHPTSSLTHPTFGPQLTRLHSAWRYYPRAPKTSFFSTMIQHRIGAHIVTPDPFFMSPRKQLVELAARHTMPAIYPSRVFVDVGGLISYGSGHQ